MNEPTIIPTEILEALQPYGLKRFIRLEGKIPKDEGWTENPKELSDPEIEEWAAKGKNLGIVAGQGLIIIDLDDPCVKNKLPLTFTNRSGSGGYHLFYRSTITEKRLNGRLDRVVSKGPPRIKENYGHIQVWHKQVVAPGSTHPQTGQKYTVDTVAPIAWIDKKTLDDIFGEDLTWADVEKEIAEDVKFQNEIVEGDISKVLPLDKLTLFGDEYRGEHPFHYFETTPSKTKLNFAYNPKKQAWYCWRHETGGGILSLIAVKEKIIRCDEATPGVLKGAKFRETLQKARDLGFKVNSQKAGPETTENKFIQYTKEGKPIIEMEAILEELFNLFTFKTPTDIEEPYYFEDGIYKPAEFKVKGLIETWIGNLATTYIVNEIIGHVKRSSYVERSEFNKYSGLIPVENGLLNLKTLKIEPFNTNRIFTFKLNATYDPEKKCPKFLKFVSEVQYPEDIPLLQEVLGYTLLPKMPKHKIFWLHGTGRNGKDRVIITLEHILGKENCAYLGLEEFNGDRRFSLYGLYGKLLNVANEPATTKILQTQTLKRITGENCLDAEVKCKQNRVTFKNIAKVFVVGNRFPKVNDTTLAFRDRTIFLTFPYSFTGEKQIDNIERQWLDDPDEVSGILNWMLLGLQRLGSNGDFTQSKSQKETMLEFQRASDSIGAWLEERTNFNLDAFATRNQTYDSYKNYCDEIGVFPEKLQTFTQRLRETPRIKDTKTRVKGKQERVWKGLELLPESGTDGTDGTPLTTSIKNPNQTQLSKELQNAVPTVPSVPPKNCGQCAKFRMPNCDSEAWETRNGNAKPFTNYCFKPMQEPAE